jgi:O-antigen ligase/tetratricopeptide (TPR) repeat protein
MQLPYSALCLGQVVEAPSVNTLGLTLFNCAFNPDWFRITAKLAWKLSRPVGRQPGTGLASWGIQEKREFEVAVAKWLLAILVLLPPLLIGGVPVKTMGIVAPLAVACVLLHVRTKRWYPGGGVPVLLGLALVSLLYWVPLPLAWLAAASPGTAATWSDAARLIGAPLPARLGLEPESARVAALHFAVYAALWGCAAGQSRAKGIGFVSQVVFATALALTVVTLLHRVFDVRQVYGWYQPLYATDRYWVGPLLNPNNLAGLANLGAFCGIAQLSRRQVTTARRLAVAASTCVLLGMGIAAGSRGGTATLTIGALLLVALSWLRPSRSEDRGRRWSLYGVAVVGAAFIALGATPEVRRELADPSLLKLEVFRAALRLIADHPWLGVGPGGFAVSLAPYQAVSAPWIYEFAENFALDWAVQWGPPVAALAVVALAACLVPRTPFRGLRRSTGALWVGCLVVTLHNLVDVGFQVPGLAVPFVAALATWRGTQTLPSTSPLASRPVKSRSLSVWKRAQLTVLLGLLALLGGTTLLRPPVLGHVERKLLGNRLLDSSTDLTVVRNALARHPGDAYVLWLGALVQLRSLDYQSALQWVTASIRRDPANGKGYLLAADVLARLGQHEQAVVTLRRAAEDARVVGEVATRVLAWTPAAKERAVPKGAAGDPLLLVLAALEADPAKRLALLQSIQSTERRAERDRALAATYLELLTRQQAPCIEREACLLRAAELIDAQLKSSAPSAAAIELRGRWLAASGRAEDGARYLLNHCPRGATGKPCIAVALELASQFGALELLEQARQAFLDAACGTAQSCAAALAVVVRRCRERGAWASALPYQQRLVALESTGKNWLELGELASLAGRRAEAQHALERAGTRPLEAADREKLEQLHEQVLRDLLVPRQ